MDIQIEINGEIVDVQDLQTQMGSPTAQALRRLVEQVEQHVSPTCDIHHQAPLMTIVVTDRQRMGVRISGCCEAFVGSIHKELKAIFEAANRLATSTTSGMLMNLVVGVRGTDKVFAFEVARFNRLVIGRIDPVTGHRPDIDLSSYGAYENGVSRRHASILKMKHGIYLMDEGSPNGTFLNDRRLPPNEPHALTYGDHIRIGRLVLEVTLDYPQRVASS
ncbi:MAG: hypothetical protein CL610_29745 [Anaerolineaceae bacterium]|nr:hypothetical protein [Anaerolineaceae bacterium]